MTKSGKIPAAFLAYMGVGSIYGVARSYSILNKVQDKTYTSEGYQTHPLTYSAIIKSFLAQQGLTAVWPLFALDDLDNYQKAKMGIKFCKPPFPYNLFEWKDQQNNK